MHIEWINEIVTAELRGTTKRKKDVELLKLDNRMFDVTLKTVFN